MLFWWRRLYWSVGLTVELRNLSVKAKIAICKKFRDCITFWHECGSSYTKVKEWQLSNELKFSLKNMCCIIKSSKVKKSLIFDKTKWPIKKAPKWSKLVSYLNQLRSRLPKYRLTRLRGKPQLQSTLRFFLGSLWCQWCASGDVSSSSWAVCSLEKLPSCSEGVASTISLANVYSASSSQPTSDMVVALRSARTVVNSRMPNPSACSLTSAISGKNTM